MLTRSTQARCSPLWAGYLWSAAGVIAATCCFWLAHSFVDKGQASLLYLPVVITCAIRFGFGPAVFASILSFGCWNYFFLVPTYSLTVNDTKDWLSLLVFLLAAVTTAQLAARARQEAAQAQAREAEMATLFDASEALSREVSAARLLDVLSEQIRTLCRVPRCVVFRRDADHAMFHVVGSGGTIGTAVIREEERVSLHKTAARASEEDRVIGFRPAPPAGTEPGVFVPLRVGEARVGVLYVGRREDDQPFSPVEERLILTLANYAATVLARETLAEQAAQAAALREADTLKDALLSLVSHELRTPLAAIKASASGLLQRDAHWDDESRGEALAAIDREADRLTGLVNHMLDLSRLEAGAWQPSKDWCAVPEVIATVLDRLPEATAARVVVDAPADLPLVRADYIQIALVLQNLLENAAKYVPGSSPIRIVASATDASIEVRVRDFGSGIVPAEESQLFTRFFRGARHRGSPIHGTGLGLALCEAVIRAHDGCIRAANAPPGESPGAVFSFTIPVNSKME